MIDTKIIKMDPKSPDKEKIKEVAEILRNGGIVAFPTETVYGLGASLENKGAVNRLYEIKSRPKDKPFTVHVSNLDMISKLGCSVTYLAGILMKEFWPGPLTIVLKGKDKKVGFRMPSNKIAKEIISESRVPLAVPSANISGEKPAVSGKEVIDKFFGKVDAIIDAGTTERAKESTVIDSTVFPFRVLREGAVAKSRIAEAWRAVTEE